MDSFTIISSLISGSLGVVIGALINHFLYWSKLKKEQKSKILSEITLDRINAIKNLKKLINELSKIEKTSITHPEANTKDVYNSIFNDWKTLNNFAERYRELRSKDDELYNIKIALDINLGDRYLWDLQMLQVAFKSDDLYKLGLFLSIEVDKWRRETIYDLNEFLNNPPLKFQNRKNLIYKIRLMLMVRKYHKSLLYKSFIKNTNLQDIIIKRFRANTENSENNNSNKK